MRPILGAAAGVVVGVALTATLALATNPWGGETVVDGPSDPAREFVAAWVRSRAETYVVVSEFERRRSGELLVGSTIVTAQRPPDRAVVSGGTVTVRRGDEQTACAEDGEGVLRCRTVTDAGDSFEDDASELSLLEGYVSGPNQLYAVERSPTVSECYDLTAVRAVAAPPYGEWARFCFDDRTGAIVRTELHRAGEVVDLTVATEVRSTVTDADLTPPAAGS